MNRLSYAPSTFKRWLNFNAVGALGIIVQIGFLWLFVSGVKLGYLPATGLAVEAAVLHNFIWHEHWTWADRTKDRNGGFMRRLLCFHVANGLVSLTGNLVLMQLLVEKLGLHYMPANLLAVAICAALNFMAGDRVVFRRAAVRLQKGGTDVKEKSFRVAAGTFLLTAASLLLAAGSIEAAVLQPETLKAWRAGVNITERRISAELSSQKGFLAFDFLSPQEAARKREAVLSGDIPIQQIKTSDAIQVPGGMIHHWRGSVFIPGVPLDFILSRVENPDLEDTKQEDVLDSRVLERTPGQLKLYLKLQRSKFVTVVYNTEHVVRFQMHGPDRASSSSRATRIAEIECVAENKEREKPEGHDRGFLWRMNSYWRYQQVEGGVIVECESMTLSRSVPFLLDRIVHPLINSTARESMHRTLQSMRARMTRAYGLNLEIRESKTRKLRPHGQLMEATGSPPMVCRLLNRNS
jgi:putative flippase GtrA